MKKYVERHLELSEIQKRFTSISRVIVFLCEQGIEGDGGQ